MSALKNIISGIANEAKGLKTASSRLIKTTPKILGSTEKAISGGRAVAKEAVTNFAKGVGGTANVGGKVFGATAIVGGAAITGAAIYDYVGDQWAVTTSQREYENTLKLAGQEAAIIKQAQDNNLAYMQKIIDMRNQGTSSEAMSASGGSDSGSLFPINKSMQEAASTKADNTNTIMYALLGITAMAAGAYAYSNRGK